MTCVDHGWVPWATNTTPGRFDEQRFQKRGLKGSLVVVATITAQLTKSFDVRDGQMKHTCQVDAFIAFSGGSILGTSMFKTVQLYFCVVIPLSSVASNTCEVVKSTVTIIVSVTSFLGCLCKIASQQFGLRVSDTYAF